MDAEGVNYHEAIEAHPVLGDVFPAGRTEPEDPIARHIEMLIRRPIEFIFPDEVEQISKSAVRRRIHRIYEEIKTSTGEASARSIAGAIADAVGCPEIAARYGYKAETKSPETGVNEELEQSMRDMFEEGGVDKDTADSFIEKWRASGYQHGFTDETCNFVYYNDGKVFLNRH